MKNLDTVSRSMEMKWGVDRLPRLVSEILRIKFDQQRNLLNEAIKSNDAARIAKQSEGMRRAWIALDQAATADGHRPLPEAVWTAKHKSGDIVTVFRDDAQLVDIAAAGGVSFTLEELVELIPAEVLVAKREFHGIKVVDVRDKTKDEDLNDEIPFKETRTDFPEIVEKRKYSIMPSRAVMDRTLDEMALPSSGASAYIPTATA